MSLADGGGVVVSLSEGVGVLVLSSSEGVMAARVRETMTASRQAVRMELE